MTIEEINCFALRGDGTLLIKTEMDEVRAENLYCFYITDRQGKTFKAPYAKESFLLHQVEELGTYQIKAFVKDSVTGEKVISSLNYVLDGKKAWKLRKESQLASAQVTLELLEGLKPPSLLFKVKGELPKDTEICWYVYHDSETETEYRSPYQKERSFLYQAKGRGRYMGKAFLRNEEEKVSIKSDIVEV